MTNIIFILPDGTETAIDASEGTSVSNLPAGL